jgi:16S rRNA (guanine(966)-N(2))-methyltransferase RsmD
VRIVGGTYGGRRIEVSKDFDSRPTTDFAREALFNILNNVIDFENSKVLDLFSGTGSISFEFSSRGCPEIDLVDINSRAVHFIGKIAGEIGMKGIHPVRMDVFRFIPICRKKYDVVFADPPFELSNIQEIPDLIFKYDLTLADGWFILEHNKSHSFKDHPRFHNERHYGSIHFSFFK